MTKATAPDTAGPQGSAAHAPVPRFPRLDTGDRVRCELARVYRLGRAGRMPWDEASKAGHLLAMLHRMLENAALDDLATRLAAVEARLP